MSDFPNKKTARDLPDDGKVEIGTTYRQFLEINPCTAGLVFYEGRDLDEKITIAEMIDNFPVDSTLVGLVDLITREDSPARLRGIAQKCAPDYYQDTGDLKMDLVNAFHGQISLAEDNAAKKQIEDNWKETIILDFRE